MLTSARQSFPEEGVLVLRLTELALFSGRVAEVTEFYAKLFGVAPVSAVPGKSMFVVDGVSVMVHEGPSPIPHEGPLFDEDGYPPDTDHFAFAVQDVDAACEVLRSRGIEAEARDFEWGRSAYVLDPDGRVVEIHGPDVT